LKRSWCQQAVLLRPQVGECEHDLRETQQKLQSSEEEQQKLREQVLQLSGDIEHAHHELDMGAEKYSDLQKKTEDQLHQLQGELDTLRVNHDCTEQQRELAEKTLEEQRAELVKLRLALSELELLKESLLFQIFLELILLLL